MKALIAVFICLVVGLFLFIYLFYLFIGLVACFSHLWKIVTDEVQERAYKASLFHYTEKLLAR